MTSILDQLRAMTVVVADTGDPAAVERYRPVDCTTNPSLILKALSDPALTDWTAREIAAARAAGLQAEALASTLTVALGAKLAKLIPGRISTEVEASLSCDTGASVARARAIVADYAARGVGRDRILIKLAATWEGIRATEILQAEGIDCNLTLLFSMAQASAAADANAFLISPFVGRIADWRKKAKGRDDDYAPEDDPGVRSVREIYAHYKSRGIGTVVMGASFRSTAQIKALAGCDNLTIMPALLDELDVETGHLPRALSPEGHAVQARIEMDEAAFRAAMAADTMASDLLADGIRRFDADHETLVARLDKRLST